MNEPAARRSWPRWRSPLAPIVLVALAVREVFSFWTGHPFDFEIWVRTGYVVAHGHNPYLGLEGPVPGSFAYLGTQLPLAAYPPFWSGLVGAIYRLWMAIGGGNRFVLYFLLKQPPIAGDLAAVYLLYRLAERWTGDRARARWIAWFWALFPYSILVSAIWGQFDAIIVAVLLAMLWARSAVERNVEIGFGVFVKFVTAIFVPLELFRARGLDRAKALIGPAVAAGLTIAVFLGAGWGFLTGFSATATSQASKGPGGMNYALLFNLQAVERSLAAVPGFFPYASYLWVIGIVLAGWVGARWLSRDARTATELRAMSLVLAAFLLLHWGVNEQYMLYLFAPLALDLALYHPGRRALFVYLVGICAAFLVFNNDFLYRFVSPIDPAVVGTSSALDASAGYGLFRTDGLYVIAVLVTIALAQVVYVLLTDEDRPVPWLVAPFAWIWHRARPAPT